jgi:hypothetical protein
MVNVFIVNNKTNQMFSFKHSTFILSALLHKHIFSTLIGQVF